MTNPVATLFRRVCADPELRSRCEADLEGVMEEYGLSEDARDVLRRQDPSVLWLLAHAVAGDGPFVRKAYERAPAERASPESASFEHALRERPPVERDPPQRHRGPQRLPELQFLVRLRPVLSTGSDGTAQIAHQASIQPVRIGSDWLGEIGGPDPEDPWGHRARDVQRLASDVLAAAPDAREPELLSLLKGMTGG